MEEIPHVSKNDMLAKKKVHGCMEMVISRYDKHY